MMDGVELFRLGRTLMKIGEDAIHRAGFHELPTSVRSILVDVVEYPDSSIGEIAARTGFPQSHVSASVARLRAEGALVSVADAADRRRTIVRPSPKILAGAADRPPAPIDGALAAALGTEDPGEVGLVTAGLERLAGRFNAEPAPRKPTSRQEFDAFYADAGTPPWEIGRPQPAFAQLASAGGLRGKVLDSGCGTGEHALLAAGQGLEATGLDASPTAIARAEAKASERGLRVRFVVGDALDLPALGERYDTILDSGLFHVFDDDDRARYVEGLRAVLSPGGRYVMLCFSDRQPGTFGPRRLTQDEIRASFTEGWRIESIEPATMEVTISQTGVLAWLSVVTRT